MGDGKWRNQYRRRHGEGSDTFSGGGSQTKITSHVSKSDISSFLIPVLKEVGKAIFPPAAIPIEILYQLYRHADAVKDASSAIMKGDYKEAAKVMATEGAKEVMGMGIGTVLEPEINKASDSLKDIVRSSLPADEQGKRVAGEIAKGTVKGLAEATADKIADKIVGKDKVMNNERGSSQTKNS
jgi:hypothetical protein